MTGGAPPGNDRPGPTSTPEPLVSPALIGRDRELSRLLLAVRARPALCTVEGEAGVGKTRLMLELGRALEPEGVRVLVGRSLPVPEAFPLGPVVEALRMSAADLAAHRLTPLAGLLAPLLPELVDVLPSPPAPAHGPRSERHRLFRALREILDVLGPTLLVLEDLHWADEETLQFLPSLLAAMPRGLALALTFRGEEVAPAAAVRAAAARVPPDTFVERLQIEPLPPADVAALVGAILGTEPVSEEFALDLHRKTAGLPFAVEELLRLLVERNYIARRTDGWERRPLGSMEVPPAVRDFIVDRAERLSSHAKTALRAAAVLGAAAPTSLLGRVADLDAPADAVDECIDRGLLREADPGPEWYEVRHELARQAVYESIPGPARRRLHRRAFEALKALSDPPAIRLAHHLRSAGDLEGWSTYAELAADRASEGGADAVAASLLEELLAAPDLAEGERRIRLTRKLAATAVHALRYERGVAALRPLVEDDRLPAHVRGELRLHLALLLEQGCEMEAGRAELMLAVEELHEAPALRARAMAALAVPEFLEVPREEHLGWLRRAREAALAIDDPVIRLAVDVNTVSTLLLLGDPAWRDALRGLPRGERDVAAARELVRGHEAFALAATYTGHYGHARALLANGAELAVRIGSTRAVTLAATKAILDLWTGRWDGLGERLLTAEDDVATMPAYLALVRSATASFLLARGEIEAAGSHVRMAIEAYRSMRAPAVLAPALAAACRLDRSGPEYDVAAVVLDVLRLVRAKGLWTVAGPFLGPAVDVLLRIDRSDDATQALEAARGDLEGRDAPGAHAGLLDARGALLAWNGRRAEAAAALAAAASAWDEAGAPYQAACSRERQALIVQADASLRLLGESLAAFEGLGASWDAARCRRLLREAGASIPRVWRGGRSGYGEALSPREVEVARLATTGRTNKEIAEVLFLSHRTVEHHLSSAMAKLGAPGRAALAEHLRRQGYVDGPRGAE